MKNGKKAWKGLKKIAKKVRKGTKKVYETSKPKIKTAYKIGKTTVKVVKRDLGIKNKKKRKKRFLTPLEFNKLAFG